MRCNMKLNIRDQQRTGAIGNRKKSAADGADISLRKRAGNAVKNVANVVGTGFSNRAFTEARSSGLLVRESVYLI